MPSERITSSNSEPPQVEQNKTCQECHGPLAETSAAAVQPFVGMYDIADAGEISVVCMRCLESMRVGRGVGFTATVVALPTMQTHNLDRHIDDRLPRTESKGALIDDRPLNLSSISPGEESDYEVVERLRRLPRSPPPFSNLPRSSAITIAPSKARANQETTPVLSLGTRSFSPKHSAHPSIPSPTVVNGKRHRHPYDSDDDYPDPMMDITRLRVRSQGYKCLYPGAIFQGTQKSGRNSYDVQVTIVDMDFASSFLCGYLRIRGLTDDWPELTTYFDAQVIGSRYGFLTQDWGASREEDKVHWSRFPAYHIVKDELTGPRLNLSNNNKRSAVFMRWKERFLVPDHKVQDINGASFAGFYYVCVDFEPQNSPAPIIPQSPSPNLTGDMSMEHDGAFQSDVASFDNGQGNTSHSRSPTSRKHITRSSSWKSQEQPAATMCGFYFHENSEPYQQLSLTHVEDRFNSSFEFR